MENACVHVSFLTSEQVVLALKVMLKVLVSLCRRPVLPQRDVPNRQMV